MLSPNTISPKQKSKSKKRIGRGKGSGTGTYSGRGIKGQRSRSGGKSGLKLRGLKAAFKSVPKVKGFSSQDEKQLIINLSDLEVKYKADSIVRIPDTKVLGQGELKKKLTVYAADFSKTAQAKIEETGGKAIKCGNQS